MAMLEICNHGLSGSKDECDSSSDVEETEGNSILTDENKAIFIELLQEGKYNWFEFISD